MKHSSSTRSMVSRAISRHQKLVAILLLIAVTILVYLPVRDHQFLRYDDDQYVSENARIQQGLTWENVKWSMTAFEQALWKPVTLLSHMLDCQLFGLNPAGHLLVNLLIHVLNVILLCGVLHLMTGAFWPSFLVAALFALHPLNVESVAWVAERKNVLSTLFWLLTLWAYLGYVRRPNWRRYLVVMAALVLGLMTKPMLVTLPCVLLLMDYWPLGRLGTKWTEFKERLPGLLLEKLPFFVPVALVSILTLYGAETTQGLPGLAELSLGDRLGNALLGYGLYLKKMVWPTDLAVIYPLSPATDWLSIGPVLLAILVLVGISLLVWRRRWRSAYLAVGWLWYLGTLVPVNGLLQSGQQAMADRYAYVPLIGVFVMLAWGVAELAEKNRKLENTWLVGAGLCLLMVLALLTRVQLSYWENTSTLFEHTLKVTSNNSIAHLVLGLDLIDKEVYQDAIKHLEQAVKIAPANFRAHTALGEAFAGHGDPDQEEKSYSEALRINPLFAEANNNLGFTRFRQGRLEAATEHFLKALEKDPQMVKARINLGAVFSRQGQIDEAIESYRQALELAPSYEAHYGLGTNLIGKGDLEGAIDHFSRALEIQPDSAVVHNNLAIALASQKRLEEAVDHFSKALEIDPQMVDAMTNLGAVQIERGQVAEAIEWYRRVLELGEGNAAIHNKLGVILIRKGETDEAVGHFSEAVRIDPAYQEARENLARFQPR